MNKYFILILINIFIVATSVFSQKLVYENDPLVLKANSLEDGLEQFVTNDLPSVSPKRIQIRVMNITLTISIKYKM
jgi:HSP20 family molecular chaperone IbpA